MSSMNKVLLMGNITRDPETRQLPSGTSVTEMRLAISENYKSRSGEQVESVCYVDVVAWDRQAETCAQFLSKGSPIMVEGRLQLDEWEKDGQKRSKLRVRASRVIFMGSPKQNSAPQQDDEPPDTAPPPDNMDEETPF